MNNILRKTSTISSFISSPVNSYKVNIVSDCPLNDKYAHLIKCHVGD